MRHRQTYRRIHTDREADRQKEEEEEGEDGFCRSWNLEDHGNRTKRNGKRRRGRGEGFRWESLRSRRIKTKKRSRGEREKRGQQTQKRTRKRARRGRRKRRKRRSTRRRVDDRFQRQMVQSWRE